MTAKVTSKTLAPLPEDAPKELKRLRHVAFRALANAEYDIGKAATSRAQATTALTQYENALLEASGQGTLI